MSNSPLSQVPAINETRTHLQGRDEDGVEGRLVGPVVLAEALTHLRQALVAVVQPGAEEKAAV